MTIVKGGHDCGSRREMMLNSYYNKDKGISTQGAGRGGSRMEND